MAVKTYKKGLKVPVSPHFTSTEFDCHCRDLKCRITYIDEELVAKLEQKCGLWGKPVEILSGFRCTRHNYRVGGKPGSQHLQGKAADIRVQSHTPSQVAKDCEDFDGLGRYASFTHVDVRGYKARWKG